MRRFEDSIAWQKARALNKAVYEATRSGPAARDWGYCGQIRRVSLSVMNNIAEGFERHRRREFHQYLSVAKGSAAEVRSMVYAGRDVGYFDDRTFKALLADAEEVTRVIAGLRTSIERSMSTDELRGLREEAALYDVALREDTSD